MVVDVPVSAFNNNAPDFETTQDICVAGTVAQGAQIAVYFTANDPKSWLALLQRMVHPDPGDPVCTVIFSSFAFSTGDAPQVYQSQHLAEDLIKAMSTWFWASYLVTTQTPGQSALQFQRQLALPRYETAFQIFHKLRAGMVRPERDCIGGEHPVEIDECLIGGRTREEGRGTHHMATVVGAVEVRGRKDAEQRAAKHRQKHAGGVPLKKLVYAGRLV